MKIWILLLLFSVAGAAAEPKSGHKANFTGLYQSKRPDGTWQIEVFDPSSAIMGFIIRESPTKGPIPDVTIVKEYDPRLFFEANLNVRKQGSPPH